MNQSAILTHLEKLVDFYPKSSDQQSVLNLLKYCQGVLDVSGAFPDTKIHVFQGVHSLTASTRGTKSPKVLLQGHVDVVPATGEHYLKTSPDGKEVTGRGVYDMLFATACYLAFIEENQAGLNSLDIGLMLTGDEEIGGFKGTAYLLDEGYGCEVCLLPDAGENFGDLCISAKGVYNFDLVVKGAAHHGSRPWEGDGAANKLMRLLAELAEAFDGSERTNSTMTITCLSGGDSPNRGPAEATAHLDIRYKDKHDYKRIQEAVAELCELNDAEVRNLIHADNTALDVANPYMKSFITLYEKHAGRMITLTKAHGGSDARFFSAKGMPVIMARPDGYGAHSDRESLSIESLDNFYHLMEEFILGTAA